MKLNLNVVKLINQCRTLHESPTGMTKKSGTPKTTSFVTYK